MAEQLTLRDAFSIKVQFYKDSDKNYAMIIEGVNHISTMIIKECIENEIRKYRKMMAEMGDGNISAMVAIHPVQEDKIFNMRIEFCPAKKIFIRNIAGAIFHFLNKPYFEDVVR